MPDEPIDTTAQSAVVLELLQRPEGIAFEQMRSTIRDIEHMRLQAAVDSLRDAAVIRCEGDMAFATAALERLDALGMVCI
jgi:hypothetical protein